MGSCLGKRSDMRAGMVLCVFWGICPLVWCCWVILVVFDGLGLGLGYQHISCAPQFLVDTNRSL